MVDLRYKTDATDLICQDVNIFVKKMSRKSQIILFLDRYFWEMCFRLESDVMCRVILNRFLLPYHHFPRGGELACNKGIEIDTA